MKQANCDRHARETDHHQRKMVPLQNKHWVRSHTKTPTDTTRVVSAGLVISSGLRSIILPTSSTHSTRCRGIVYTPRSPSDATGRRPLQRSETAGDSIAEGFWHSPRSLKITIARVRGTISLVTWMWSDMCRTRYIHSSNLPMQNDGDCISVHISAL